MKHISRKTIDAIVRNFSYLTLYFAMLIIFIYIS